MSLNTEIKAILWDFGGVFTSSPFEAFVRYEQEHNLPENFIRRVNSTNPNSNAWAKLESNAISREKFDTLFREESRSLGHEVSGTDVLGLLSGTLRPRMVDSLKLCKQHFKVGCITNNMKPIDVALDTVEKRQFTDTGEVMTFFDVIIESSIEGVRKPNPKIYEIACAKIGSQPNECVFLDDLGINLKPARAMGMRTIKVVDPDIAIEELSGYTGLTFP
ncbi:MAG: HAD-IA family hydrolase [Gammaproteobacteria bacterium]|nr:HAD-IA family hydrolase [Gammaproteobacteria bacterium]